MSEYANVEKPFLEKLRALGWEIIDHGGGAEHPTDPTISRRTSFGETGVFDHFREWVGKLNPWATPAQLEKAFTILTTQTGTLLEANKFVFGKIREGLALVGEQNATTGEMNPTLRLVDFNHPENNGFLAVNQFRLDTPGMAKGYIVPDIVCLVNGLPWIVVECKDEDVAEPLSDAWDQIRRYSNQRKDPDDSYAEDEGKEEFFHANLFNVITHGKEARFGTISGEFDYYYNWQDIFPEKFKTPDTAEGGVKQTVLIGGMFNHEILLDIFRNFTLFMNDDGFEYKVVCRYQQYRAVGKMIERMKAGEDFRARSGVVWHTQGSGKSLTMVFLVRKMRTEPDLRDWKVVMIVDRNDLEDQMGDTALLTGEGVTLIEHQDELDKLADDTANLNLVMIHKFGVTEKEEKELWDRLRIPPKVKSFETINSRDKVLLLVDEAHRSQGGDMAKNLFIAFPNATRVGFTGTPLLTPRHKVKTAERFYCAPNEFIDTYKMNDAVRDHATVDVMYIGKQTSDRITDREAFDQEYELAFSNRTEAERQEIMRRYGDMVAYLETEDRVNEIAKDLMIHYVSEVLPNGFKAMVVAVSIKAAVRFKVAIEKLIPEFIHDEESKPEGERDEVVLTRLKMLKARAVVSTMGNNEPSYITSARREGQGKSVIDAYRKSFDPEKPETGIGILCVCDRLLTGFDAPIAQVMYLDRSLKEHGLMQAIARVNRMKKDKGHGILVDYFGVTKNLTEALGIYSDADREAAKEDLREFGEYFKSVERELPELEARYAKILAFFEENGIAEAEGYMRQTLANGAADKAWVERVIALVEDIEKRAQLDGLVKDYLDRLDLLFHQPSVQKEHWVPAKRLGFLVYSIGQFYKDPTMDLKFASRKVRILIDKYVKNQSITEHIPAVGLLSDDFPVIAQKYAGKKSQASAMEHAIRWQIKENLDRDPGFYERFKDRLEAIITRYGGNWEQMVKEFEQLKGEMDRGRPHDDRFKPIQATFYDCLKAEVGRDVTKDEDEKIVRETKNVCSAVKTSIVVSNFWVKPLEVQKLHDQIAMRLRLGLRGILADSDAATRRIMTLCKSNYGNLLRKLDDLA